MADISKIPLCIGIILDGNRRWAKENGLPTLEGHRRGADRLKECTRWVRQRGIKNLVVFVFSTENWNRKEGEVSTLLELLQQTAEGPLKELAGERIRVRAIGKMDMFPQRMRDAIAQVESVHVENVELTLWLCLSYGSRAEITAAAQHVAASGKNITEESLRQHFWSAEMPDPDLVIRTGGAQRLSNFLLWQAAYSELFFLDIYWPDFSEQHLNSVLDEFNQRTRRFGI